MKLRLHHIEICVKDPAPVVKLLREQLGLKWVGYRETDDCIQYVVKHAKTAFIVTSRKGQYFISQNNNVVEEALQLNQCLPFDNNETWTSFCCDNDTGHDHIDSVFNVAVEVKDITATLQHVKSTGASILCDLTESESSEGVVKSAVVKSCCGNVVHTIIDKKEYSGWFLPGFHRVPEDDRSDALRRVVKTTHFDHFTLACRVGETDGIIQWYERVFGMKRFVTNRQETEEDGLMIGDDVGLRLKVMEFWKCSEIGIGSVDAKDSINNQDEYWEPLKIVIAESLPNIRNTQIESFIEDHGSPGIQHLGLHTDNMVETVRELTKLGMKFRHPPPTYYTEIGQLGVIESAGEDVATLRQYGILLDNEADVFSEEIEEDRYLMQVFTHPIFGRDTFFLEVIQRKGARGFGVGNVTALARSVNAYKEMMLKKINETDAILELE